MLKHFSFLRRKAPAPTAPARIPEGKRVYAIGDVHGMLDPLRLLMDAIEADDRARGPADTHVVMLGDLIDRGPASAQVIDYLLDERPDFATFHFVMGNHEEAMVKSLAEGADPREVGWLSYGGWETLDSYAVPEAASALRGSLLSDELRRHIPERHIAFLQGMPSIVRIGDYAFVHAGVRPGVPIEEQRSHDLRWIRRDFLDSEEAFGAVIVHGHTITQEPELKHNRIGIDTGAYMHGTLTAVGLQGAERWILASRDGAIADRSAARRAATQ